MSTLTDRFDAVQEQILSLIEKGSTHLADHVKYWDLIRREGVLQYYARKNNISRLGLHQVPSQLGAENKAKKAIQMGLLLRSLQESPYGTEPWTVSETSLELFEQTDPERTFKKGGRTIEVWYDNDPENSVAYTLWRFIYVQDENGQWHRCHGGVDYWGLYYTEVSGGKTYYEEFFEDADRYGQTSTWTVKDKNCDISAPVTSSGKSSEDIFPQAKRRRRDSADITQTTVGPEDSQETPQPRSSERSSGTPHTGGRRGRSESTPTGGRRGGEPREYSPAESPITCGPASPETGRRSQGVPRNTTGRIERVHFENRDPPVLLLTGPANSLKCWRNRVRHRPYKLYTRISTCFSWVTDDGATGGSEQRLMIAFKDRVQRELFLKNVTIPRGSRCYKGTLDGL